MTSAAQPFLQSIHIRPQCDARTRGLKTAQQLLQGFRGWDKRLCMMQVLELFRGQGSVEEVRRLRYRAGGMGRGDRHTHTHLHWEATTPPPHLINPPPQTTTTTTQQVLEGACGDRHSAARASFASALYFEARGDGNLAVPLLRAVAELDGDGDLYLYALAKAHLGRMLRRLAAQGATARVHPGPLTQALSPKRLNSPYLSSGVVAPLSQSC